MPETTGHGESNEKEACSAAETTTRHAPDGTNEHELSLRLLGVLAQLPERERRALVLHQYHGWKLADIAEQLDCSPAAVAGLQARALSRLRQLLPEMG